MLLLLLQLACVPTTGVSSLNPEHGFVYRFEVTGTFTTEALDASGQPLAAAAALEEARLSLRGALEQRRARSFRDGSEGHLVTFLEVEASQDGGEWAPWALGGRSLELRTFPTGEILDLYELEHVAGPGRHADLFDLLYPVLSPVVPRVTRGEEAWRRASWPFSVSRDRQLRTMLNASYRNEEILNLPQGRSARLPYTGTMEGKGQDSEGPARLSLEGEASGEVFMRLNDARMVDHSFTWTQRLSGAFEATGATLTQVRSYTGRMTLEEER
ncbi:MAG: hypothetical protein H6741_11085 [Alphaproteobacteria bacterium]|nr:hypothetical protein [Alphaproteobacteria bacterium]